ncbi:lactosylceramide 4-alpha-galactosyltransferase-like isoform X2 [Periplaneta americana]|uniref:lactosylceramide 4-alpha-galactosyltransferase-like isoform X2 n=1 Tax=Periplaneta americana TaxID=6978 RepID=UPI0037E8571F
MCTSVLMQRRMRSGMASVLQWKVHRLINVPRLIVLVVVIISLFLLLRSSEIDYGVLPYRQELFNTVANSAFQGFNNETGSEDGEYIVPNIVHFLFLGITEPSFVDTVCVLAAFKNHRPDKIYFHTDVEKFEGYNWEKLKGTPDLNIEINKVTLPDEIFGQKFSSKYHRWHASDVLRILILMKYGGIFLDNDSFVVRNLDEFRKFEMVLGWPEGQYLGTQVLVAHKDARFLRLWLETYRQYYPNRWYFNAGEKPTKEILWFRPDLVHRVKTLFGVHDLADQLYRVEGWKEWRKYYAIHLLIRHRYYRDHFWNFIWWPTLHENNIQDYPKTFGEMARDVYFD